LATLPSTIVNLLDILKDTSTCADDVRVVLERDPAMTANILKLANSAYYGVRRTISSVRDALVMLGNRSVATLAFATGMTPILRRDLAGYGEDREELWRHCVIAGAAAALAADLSGNQEKRCEAFTAGLVHDSGKLIINDWLMKERLTLPATSNDAELRAAEIDLLGFDHAEAGAELALAWGFPEALVDALRFHHEPSRTTGNLEIVRAVAAADVVSHAFDSGARARWSAETIADLALIGFAASDFNQLQLDLEEDLDQTLAAATRSGRVTV